MNEEMLKSLTALIDESLAEMEELKKSDRFSASEISLGDSDSGMGKDKNGSIGKAEKDRETEPGRQPQEEGDIEEDHDDDDDDDKKKKKDDKAEKAEGVNAEADPNAGSHKIVKEETGMPEGTAAKAEGKNSEADPNAGSHKMAKSEAPAFGDELKKSRQETETLMKSYIDEKVGGLESKLEAIAKAVQDLANSPMPSKGSTYRDVRPLKKSEDAPEVLSKSQVVERLFELKKSGEKVDTVDIASAELGQPGELARLVDKYNIK